MKCLEFSFMKISWISLALFGFAIILSLTETRYGIQRLVKNFIRISN